MASKRSNWAKVSEALRYFFVGVMTTIAGTDIISPSTIKWLTLGLGLAVLGLKAIDMAVLPTPRKPKDPAE